MKRFVVKKESYDPYSSNGWSEIGNEKDLTVWLRDGSLGDGDQIFELTFHGTVRVGLFVDHTIIKRRRASPSEGDTKATNQKKKS